MQNVMQKKLHDNHDNPPLQNKVVITHLLLEGWHAARIAKKLGISRQAVAKHIKKLVVDGKIKQISNKPAMYARQIHDNPPLKPVAYDNQKGTRPTILPHHYGGVFALQGRPPLKYDRWGKAHEKKQAAWTAQFGRHRAQLWLKSFRGASPKEIRENAHQDLLALAQHFEQKFQIRLTLIKIYTNIEWAMADQETSDKIADSLGLAKQEAILIDNVWHKNGDKTHDTMEFIPTAKNPTGASKHADAHHFVYSGELAKTLNTMGSTMEKIGDAIIRINQRLMRMEEK